MKDRRQAIQGEPRAGTRNTGGEPGAQEGIPFTPTLSANDPGGRGTPERAGIQPGDLSGSGALGWRLANTQGQPPLGPCLRTAQPSSSLWTHKSADHSAHSRNATDWRVGNSQNYVIYLHTHLSSETNMLVPTPAKKGPQAAGELRFSGVATKG